MDQSITDLITRNVSKGKQYAVRILLVSDDGEEDTVTSRPINSLSEALEVSARMASKLVESTFPDMTVSEVDPEETDGFHLIIHSGDFDPVALVAIDTHTARRYN